MTASALCPRIEETKPGIDGSTTGPPPSAVAAHPELMGVGSRAFYDSDGMGRPKCAVELVLNDVAETMLVALDQSVPDDWSARSPGVVQVGGLHLSDRVALVNTGDFLDQLGRLVGWRVLFLAASSRFIIEEGFHDTAPISWMPTFRDEAFVLMEQALVRSTF